MSDLVQRMIDDLHELQSYSEDVLEGLNDLKREEGTPFPSVEAERLALRIEAMRSRIMDVERRVNKVEQDHEALMKRMDVITAMYMAGGNGSGYSV